MKSNKVLTLLLAVIMIASLAVPASADTQGNIGNKFNPETKIESEMNEPKIIVNIPTAITMVVNPYRLMARHPDASPEASNEFTNKQVIANNQYVVNLSNSNLTVSLGVKGEAPTGIALVAAPVAANQLAKQYHLYLETQVIEGVTNGDLEASAPDVTWQGSYKGNVKAPIMKVNENTYQFLFNGTQLTQNNLAVLEKADWTSVGVTEGNIEAEPADGSYGDIEPSTHGWLAFTIDGGCSEAPTDAWTQKDAPKATVTFSFNYTSAGPSYQTP